MWGNVLGTAHDRVLTVTKRAVRYTIPEEIRRDRVAAPEVGHG